MTTQAFIPTSTGQEKGELRAVFGDLRIIFTKGVLGMYSISIHQDSQRTARSVEVTLQVFFGGTITETFPAKNFVQGFGLFHHYLQKNGFPKHIYDGMLDGAVFVSARYID